MSKSTSVITSWDDFATDYHARVLSPFAPSVRFRLKADVRRLLKEWRDAGNADRRVVFDCGSGIGDGLELVASHVGLAVGLDLSRSMLEESRKRLRARGITCERVDSVGTLKALCHATARDDPPGNRRLVLIRQDISRLRVLHGVADLVLAINSISPETAGEAATMLSSVAGTLSPNGVFMGVFPSFDTLEYLFALAARRGKSMRNLGTIDGSEGMFVNMYGERQKCYTPEEIKRFCVQRRLKIERLEKIRYPWSLTKKHGWGYFPGSPRLWDWYLLARRTRTTNRSSP